MVASTFKTTTFCYKFKWNLNSYSQTLTLLFITYTSYPSNVPLFLWWHQLRSQWATLQYQCYHFLQPQRVECPSKYRKEKQWESTVVNGWVCFSDDYTFQMCFKHNSVLIVRRGINNETTQWPPHHRHGFCLCKGFFLLNHEFQTF